MKNQEKIIEIWKSGDKTLALILGRTIMKDGDLLNFCTNTGCINHEGKTRNIILKLQIDYHYFNIVYMGTELWVEHNTTFYQNTFPPKNGKALLNIFRRFLTKVCGPRFRKPKQI